MNRTDDRISIPSATTHRRDARFFLRVSMFALVVMSMPTVQSCGIFGVQEKSKQETVQQDECVRPAMRSVVLRWGDWNDTTKVLDGFELDARGCLYKTKAAEFSERYMRDSLCMLPQRVFCRYADTVRTTFLKIQSLTVRAPRMRYIEYQNHAAGVNMRAVWDRRFETYGSREFRAIFDSLSTNILHHTP